jgi:ketosteroid isomerase-like protein
MSRTVAFLALGLALLALGIRAWAQDPEEPPPNPELQRQEIVNIENETARAMQLNNGTFFRRVYSDDFAGTLSHGRAVDRNGLIQVVQSEDLKYQVFLASDIKVRLFRDTAVATCLWTFRGEYRGEHFNGQMRVTHVFLNTPRGWHVVAEQNTALPPDGGPPL